MRIEKNDYDKLYPYTIYGGWGDEVYCDEKGLRELKKEIEKILDKQKRDNKMKFYVLGSNCDEYVEMTMEEIQTRYGENISQGMCGCEVLVLTKMEKDALYFRYCEFEC